MKEQRQDIQSEQRSLISSEEVDLFGLIFNRTVYLVLSDACENNKKSKDRGTP